MRQVVGDVVGGFVQQRLQGGAGFVELAALDLGNRQTITGDVIFWVFIQLLAEPLGGQTRCVFVLQLDPCANQLIAQAVFGAADFGLLSTVAGVGNTRLGHRVSQQKFRRLGVKAVLAHQALKHGGHGARVVTGLFKVEDADTVSLLLVLARETSLLLKGRCLGAGDGGNTGVTGARGGDHNTGEQGRHHGQLHALLGFYTAGKVALRQVSKFVGQH